MKFVRLVFLAFQVAVYQGTKAQIIRNPIAALALSYQNKVRGFPCATSQDDTYCIYGRLFGDQAGTVLVSANTTVHGYVADPLPFLRTTIFFYRKPDIGHETYFVYVTVPDGSTRVVVAPTAQDGTGLMAVGAGPRNASVQSWNITQEGGSSGGFGEYSRKYLICVPDQPDMCWSGSPGQNVTLQNITRPPPAAAIFFLSFGPQTLDGNPDHIWRVLTQHYNEASLEIDGDDPDALSAVHLYPNRTRSSTAPGPTTTQK